MNNDMYSVARGSIFLSKLMEKRKAVRGHDNYIVGGKVEGETLQMGGKMKEALIAKEFREQLKTLCLNCTAFTVSKRLKEKKKNCRIWFDF